MKYEEFVSAVETEVSRKLKGDESAGISKVIKNNGKCRQGITIRRQGSEEAPTIYLEEYYDSYQKGTALEQIAEELMRFYRSMKWKPDIDPDSVADYRGVKWRIVPKLVSRGKNEALLREQPFAAWLDLAVTFYVLIDAGGNGTTTMPVCHSHLKKWGITTKTLYESAMLNAPCLLPAELLSIDGIIRELSCSGAVRPDNLLKEGAAADRMYVLSNQIRCFGAACILYPHMGRLIADVLRESYYVLPSSVHETIIVPKSSGFTREMFGDMIREVNTTHLEEEDILSEHAYYYDRKKDEFSL